MRGLEAHSDEKYGRRQVFGERLGPIRVRSIRGSGLKISPGSQRQRREMQ